MSEKPIKIIRFERDGDVGHLVLANPPYNRVNTEFAVRLREAVHEASASAIRVLLLRAEGPNFSLGGEVREWPGKDEHWFRTFVAEVNASYRALEALRIPTVAAVQGAAFGIIAQVVPAEDLARASAEVARHLSTGPTRAYAATRALLKAWSSGGLAAA